MIFPRSVDASEVMFAVSACKRGQLCKRTVLMYVDCVNRCMFVRVTR